MGRPRTPRHPVAAVVVLVAMVLAIGTPGSVARAASGTDEWDPRITDLAREVERLRGLDFRHPVPVVVLDDAAFEKRFNRGGAPTRRERAQWDETQSALVGMGLLDQPLDIEEIRSAGATNVAGYYDPDRGAIVVRGSSLEDPDTRITLVHELTHALQDQHYDLARLEARASRADSMFTTALFEGDATDVETRYYASLGAREQDRADTANDAAIAEVTPLPPILEAMFYAPYDLGYLSVELLRALRGRAGLDAVMHRPPTRDLALLDPTALVGPRPWSSVDPPALDAGDVAKGDPFPLDAVVLYLVLAERMPWVDALAVAERWGGDQTAVFTRDGQPCTRTRIAGRAGAADAAAIADAFRGWGASGGTDTTVSTDGAAAVITLCDPVDHRGAPTPTPPAQAMIGLTIRNQLVAELVQSGLGLAPAKCVADRLARLPEMTQATASVQTLTDAIPDAASEALRTAVGDEYPDALLACRTRG